MVVIDARRKPVETAQTDTDHSAWVGLTETKPAEVAQPESEWIIRRPKRAKMSAEESIRRTEEFINDPKSKEEFIAAVRKRKG